MKPSSKLAVTRPKTGALLGFCMTLMLVFLQEGFTYYLSIQMLALGVMLVVVYKSRASPVNLSHLLLAVGLFLFFLAVTATYSPMVVSRNSSSILVTIIGITGYAFLIALLANLVPKRTGLILHSFRFASAAVVFTLAGLMALTDLNFIPTLNRDALLLQNNRLVTNFADEDMLQNELAYRTSIDAAPRLDLFYGEASYLGIVLFTCVVCFMLTSRLIAEYQGGLESVGSKLAEKDKYGRYVVIVGIMSLLSLQSLSSIMYALALLFLGFMVTIRMHLSFSKLLLFIAFMAVLLFAYRDSLQYFLFRLTMEESVSLVQRFGSLLDFGVSDYLFGLRDESKIPEEGFHNGLFYIIAISGLAGIGYTIFILRTVQRLAKPIKMSSLLTLVVLALIMQNGAVFSPNKVVLFALILLPLSCVRTVYAGNTSRIPVRLSSD